MRKQGEGKQSIGSLQVYLVGEGRSEDGSDTSIVKCSKHGAHVGDLLLFTSGFNVGLTNTVHRVVDEDSFVVAHSLPRPLGEGNTFEIHRLEPVWPAEFAFGELAVVELSEEEFRRALILPPQTRSVVVENDSDVPLYLSFDGKSPHRYVKANCREEVNFSSLNLYATGGLYVKLYKPATVGVVCFMGVH